MGNRFSYTWEVVTDYVQKKWKVMAIIAAICYGIAFYIGSLLSQNLKTIDGTLERVHAINPIFVISYGFTGMGMMICLLFGTAASFFFIYRKILIDMQELSRDERGFEISQNGTYGTSHLMNAPERKEILEEKEIKEETNNILGMSDDGKKVYSVIGGYKNKALGPHKFVCGCSGSWKTSSQFLVDIMQAIQRGESLIVTDPKGELRSKCYKLAKKYGYTVKEINTIYPLLSDACNFMDYVESYNDARSFTDIIMANTSGDGVHKEDFWAKGERSAICTGILYVKEAPEYKGKRTFQSVYDFLVHNELDAINDKIDAIEDEHSFAKRQWDIFKTTPENSQGGIITGVATRLDILNDDVIGAMTGYSEIDLIKPGKEKCMYFVVISDHDKSNRLISSLYFSFQIGKLIDYADTKYSQCCDVPVNFILDEMPSIGHINNFSEFLSVARSRGLRFTLCAQNIGQIMDMYQGNLWTNIIGNCDTTVVLGVNDSQITAPYFSRKSGEMTIRVDTERQEFMKLRIWNFSPSYQKSSGDGKRMVFTPAEIEQMPVEYSLVFLRGRNVFKVKKFSYFYHPMYEDMEKENYILHQPEWWEKVVKNAQSKEDIAWFAKEKDRIDGLRSGILEEEKKKHAKEQKIAEKSKKEREEASEDFDPNELPFGQYLLYVAKKTKLKLTEFKEYVNGDNTWSFGVFKSKPKSPYEEEEETVSDELDTTYMNGEELVQESKSSYESSYIDSKEKIKSDDSENTDEAKAPEKKSAKQEKTTPSKKKKETVAERIKKDFDDTTGDDDLEEKPVMLDGKTNQSFAASAAQSDEYQSKEEESNNTDNEFEEIEDDDTEDIPYGVEDYPDDMPEELENELENEEDESDTNQQETETEKEFRVNNSKLAKQLEELEKRDKAKKEMISKAKQKTTKGL